MEKKKIDKHDSCPECGKSWDAGLIWKAWRKMDYYKDKTDEELKTEAKKFYSAPYRFSHLVGVEIPEKYDGVSEWHCPFCNSNWDRWTNEFLGKKELK